MSTLYARRRPHGPSLGSVPLLCVVVVETGLAAAVVLVALDRRLLPVAGGVLAIAVLVGLLRWRERWVVRWLGLGVRFRLRPRIRDSVPGAVRTSADDPRLRALRVLVGDLSVAQRPDHDGREVGLVGHEGAWCAVLTSDASAPDPTDDPEGQALLAATTGRAGPATASFPLGALAGELADRGVVLDAVTALWHCRPGGAELAADAPAVVAYREVLGPLPCLSRRDAWLVVRLDPTRCPDAVAERGGGTVGTHRALLGALARIRRVLDVHGVPVRPLGPDEVLRAASDAAVLGAMAARPDGLRMSEQWGAVVVGAVGHTTYGVTSWQTTSPPDTLDALTDTGAAATTLALTIEPGPDGDRDGDGDHDAVGLRGMVRLAARTPEELDAAGRALQRVAADLGLRIDPLDGQQAAGLAATLPLGTAP